MNMSEVEFALVHNDGVRKGETVCTAIASGEVLRSRFDGTLLIEESNCGKYVFVYVHSKTDDAMYAIADFIR